MEHTLWIAEAENGAVQFDACPSNSDVRNCCEGLEGKIEVYEVVCLETSRSYLFAVDDESEGEPE